MREFETVAAALLEPLQRGLRQLGEDPAAHPCDRYLQYLGLLQRWNRAYNLSGIREPVRMLSYHLLDALAVLPYLGTGDCLDVGSGAGVPGLVLAMARPGCRWVLLDSNGKKARFLRHAVAELGLGNVEVAQCRLEQFRPPGGFSFITCRAFGPLPKIYRQCRPLLAAGGVILAMKGADPLRDAGPELQQVADLRVVSLSVPGVEGERTLVIMAPTAD